MADAPAVTAEPAPRGTGKIRRLVATSLRYLMTGTIVIVALLGIVTIWSHYVTSPWTRDGRVRVQVAAVAPRVSGEIVELRVVDNQPVHKGDVLYAIDPFDFKVALDFAQANLSNKTADLENKRERYLRREKLTTLSTSLEEKGAFDAEFKIADAGLAAAQTQLSQAQINLKRTEVRSPVDGVVTNLLLRVGDYATSGAVNISVIDSTSYWVDAYFEETKMAKIRIGDSADMTLLGYPTPLRGTVESITLGISTSDAAPSTQGLPNVDPVYTWVRLAQRVPVRIRIETIPPGVTLVAGMTCSVSIGDVSLQVPDWLIGVKHRFLPRLTGG